MGLRSTGVIASLAKRKIVMADTAAYLAPDVRRPTNTGMMVFSASIGAVVAVLAGPALADCNSLPGNAALKSALSSSITAASGPSGGLGFNMWARSSTERDRVRSGVYWRKLHVAMARQPSDFCAEGEHW
jgi:hypothetical protein